MTPAEELRYLMLAAQRDGNRMLADLLRPHQLTPAQGEVLRVLAERPGLSLAELGQRLVCETGSPSRLVDGLVTARLVERAPGPDDRRQIALTLTGAGRPKARAVQDIEHSLHDYLYLAAATWPPRSGRANCLEPPGHCDGSWPAPVGAKRSGSGRPMKRSRSEELAR